MSDDGVASLAVTKSQVDSDFLGQQRGLILLFFVEMWERMGGEARYDRRRDWFAQHRDRFVDGLG